MQPLWQQILNSNPMAGKAVVPLWQKILQPKTMQPPAFPSPASIVPLWQKIIGGQQGETFLQTYQRVGAENTAATKAVFDPNAPEELREKGMQRFADMTFGFTGTLQNVAKKGAIKSVQALKGFADDVVKNIDLSQQARKYKSAEEFVKAQPTLSKAERQAVEGSASMKAYINDTTPLGRGVEIHEMTERPIYFNTPRAGQGKLPAGHTQALDAEINYYKSLVPELNKYKTSEIDNVVVKRLQEKYGKGIYGNELSSPIPFKAKSATEQEIYNLIKNKLEKIDTKSQLTDIWKEANK